MAAAVQGLAASDAVIKALQQVEIAGRAMPQVEARQGSAAGQRPRWIDARERGEHARLESR